CTSYLYTLSLHDALPICRYYPFFPMVIAQVKNDFLWKGHDFKKDTHVLLDLYGTNHHPDLWENPDHFQSQRFSNWDESPFSFKIDRKSTRLNSSHVSISY